MSLPSVPFNVELGKVSITIRNHVGTLEETEETFFADDPRVKGIRVIEIDRPNEELNPVDRGE
jgi:hypothetical protein